MRGRQQEGYRIEKIVDRQEVALLKSVKTPDPIDKLIFFLKTADEYPGEKTKPHCNIGRPKNPSRQLTSKFISLIFVLKLIGRSSLGATPLIVVIIIGHGR